MATPAQVANDMVARAAFWRGRDKAIEGMCFDAARVIRLYLIGTVPDGRTVTGVLTRIYGLDRPGAPDIVAALNRAAATITQLRKEARDAQA